MSGKSMLLLFALAQVTSSTVAPPDSTWSPANVGVLATVIGAAIVTVITAWKMAKIEAHVNSEKTAMHEQAVAKDMEIALLREMLAERKTTAALLAQAAIGVKQSTGSSSGAVQSLENIDTQTKGIESNTMRTEAKVQKLTEDE